MSSKSSPIVPLVLALVASVAVAVGISKLGNKVNFGGEEKRAVPVTPRWAATAEGRVEPKTGEIKLSALTPGRIADVLVSLNDKVRAGDLLVRIDDADALARVMGADAEAGVRKRERDGETGVPKLVQDRRSAEDRLHETERSIMSARLAFDRLQLKRHSDPASVTNAEIDNARRAVDSALGRLPADREALRQAQVAAGVPLPTRLEAGLTTSRAELSAAEAAFERTRIRAPHDGTVLQIFARPGELAAASPEQTMLIVADLSRLSVKAEVQERDASKVRVGQEVVLKTDAYPDQEFEGKVEKVANAMRPPKLVQRGPRRPNDVDALEVVVDVAPGAPLMPGMRVDTYFKIDGQQSSEPRADASMKTGGAIVSPAQAAVKSN
ncbi:MAG: HlyD family secretion protein [Hyphomicrobiaceae bacterium]